MAIRRDQLGKTDFSDVSSGRRLAPVHPGAVRLKDFIEPTDVSRYDDGPLTGVVSSY